MHPAYSVILFTTASGAGYGLLIGLAVAGVTGLTPRNPMLGLFGLGIALALITAGLLSSTAHLGRPERAWRAFSQWRSSWLSREGVAAVATYVPAGVLGLGWVFGELVPGQVILGAALVVPCALATLWCTGMIYGSLPTIRAWHQPLTTPIYVMLGLATGGVLLTLLLAASGYPMRWAAVATAVALVIAASLKRLYWTAIDSAKKTWTAEAATGLGQFGTVRPLDPPHTQPNYVMREMGYRVARTHADKLRRMVIGLLFLLPIAGALLQLLELTRPVAIVIAGLSMLSATIGVLLERWLFFAEAEHVVMLYYRGGEA